MATTPKKYQYRVDATDAIVSVDPLWIAFAQENGAEELTEQSVVGRSLWDFFAGDETRALFKQVHALVRSRGKKVVLPFRCDSPNLERHMRMTISDQGQGQLSYDNVIVRAVPQFYLGLLDTSRPRSRSFLTMCSCCKRCLLEPHGWLDVVETSLRLRLFEAETPPELRHTICPTCADTQRYEGE